MFSLKDRHKSSTTADNSPSSSSSSSSTSTSSNRTSYRKSTKSSMDYSMLPKKIIKATLSYNAQHQHELSFEKGDFFHVVGRENDHHWFAVNNPLTNITGLVPVSYFEVVDKTTRTMNAVQPVLPLDHHHAGYKQGTLNQRFSIQPLQQQQQKHCYGLVLYDFVAERPDELDCKANEAIIVIAQSNKEWFVAKPIGRLGGPGLIPVSFVQLHDIITDSRISLPTDRNPSSSFSSASETTSATASPRISITIPKLEDWKKQTQKYEASSILVGDPPSSAALNHDDRQKNMMPFKSSAGAGAPGRFSLSSSMSSSLSDQYHKHSTSRRQTKLLQPISSSIDPIITVMQQQRCSYESTSTTPRRNSEFIVVKDRKAKQRQSQLHHPSLYTPLPATLSDNATTDHTMKMPIVVEITVDSFVFQDGKYWFVLHAIADNGKHRILRRTYECFYQSHVHMLQTFPEEAGKGEKRRILPFMPGPLDEVDDYITEQRREDLDLYCKTLLALPFYLSTCNIVQVELLGLKNGDVESDNAPTSTTTKENYSIQSTANFANDELLPTASAGLPATKTKSAPGFSGTGGTGTTTTYSTDMYYNSGVGKVKIKIVHKDDIFAVKIPADCTLQELELRVTDRLGGTLGKMKYKDDVHHQDATYLPLETELDMEEAFILAIQRGKLTIVVE
ncbi:hypothetical protein BCR42DRAFT_488573 [Absidia repens]|uniref:SH3 domain-containing protein n=1 Tax=Absidia repens TaxID=90262 RepID=A0A1X2ISN2_9FUNG|nr:hypothetical protein BCR42DRAFT_488573 [Absidia repens]